MLPPPTQDPEAHGFDFDRGPPALRVDVSESEKRSPRVEGKLLLFSGDLLLHNTSRKVDRIVAHN
jgi:hypothetical protein